MLRFGADRIFAAAEGRPPTDAELDAIIDRTEKQAAVKAGRCPSRPRLVGHLPTTHSVNTSSQGRVWLSLTLSPLVNVRMQTALRDPALHVRADTACQWLLCSYAPAAPSGLTTRIAFLQNATGSQ